MRKKGITRREFHASLAAMGGTLLLGGRGQAAPAKASGTAAPDAAKAKVVLVRDAGVIDDKGVPRPEVVQRMIDLGMAELTGQKDPKAAWLTILKPSDVVGIKSNGWKYLPTPKQVEDALRRRVLDAGVARDSIAVADWGVIEDPIFKRATALINTRPMRTHYWAGVGSLIKNYIQFAEDRPALHPDSCADLATLWSLPQVKGKTRLNVLVMLTPQFHSVGPHGFNPKYVWRYHGLLLGFDPVAVDSVGLRIIEAKRREFFGDDRPFETPAKHIALADTRHHLGTADPAKIELVKVGYEKDLLL